jgi:hypothetical protein
MQKFIGTDNDLIELIRTIAYYWLAPSLIIFTFYNQGIRHALVLDGTDDLKSPLLAWLDAL